MNNFKKQFFLVLFMICAGLFTASSASAQTWYINPTNSPAQNPCIIPGATYEINPPTSGNCQCNQGYTYGIANAGNCSYDGAIIGCWNPGTGKCQACGSGGTVVLGENGCFSNGQTNSGGTDPGVNGVACTLNVDNSPLGSTACVGSGTTSGGFSTN
jgi:hypothetical protein